MAKVHKLSGGNFDFMIFCPACKCGHGIDTKRWQFNGDMEKPTISPSILVRSGHYMPEHKGSCWCNYNEENKDNPAPFKCGVCHSFVTDGKIQYLSDCTHELAGQTVELEDF